MASFVALMDCHPTPLSRSDILLSVTMASSGGPFFFPLVIPRWRIALLSQKLEKKQNLQIPDVTTSCRAVEADQRVLADIPKLLCGSHPSPYPHGLWKHRVCSPGKFVASPRRQAPGRRATVCGAQEWRRANVYSAEVKPSTSAHISSMYSHNKSSRTQQVMGGDLLCDSRHERTFPVHSSYFLERIPTEDCGSCKTRS